MNAREFSNGQKVQVIDPKPAPDVPREGTIVSKTRNEQKYLVRMRVPKGGFAPLVMVPAADLARIDHFSDEGEVQP